METVIKLKDLLIKMENSNIQVYETYRVFYDEFKALFKEFLKDENIETLDLDTKRELGSVILKAIDMRVILKDKYEELGKELLCR